jgi:hypothetical protein
MKIKKSYKLEEACSTDANREGICSPWIETNGESAKLVTGIGPRAIATDGKILAVVPCEWQHEDTGNRIALKALKESRKAGGSKCEHAFVSLTETHSIAAGGAQYPVTQYAPPRMAGIVPGENRAPAIAKIRLDASLLLRLAKALGSQNDRVLLEIGEESDVVIVRPMGENCDEAFGLIMPVRA